MPVKRVNWLALVKHVVCWEIALFLETSGRFLEQPVNLRTCDGFGEVFAANIMGHYLMVSTATCSVWFKSLLSRFDFSRTSSRTGDAYSGPDPARPMQRTLIWTTSNV